MVKFIISLFTVVFCMSFSSIDVHDFHISKSELEYDASKSVVKLYIKIFIDDLEAALAERGVEGLKIGTEKESEDSVEHIGAYLSDAFQVISGSANLDAQMLGTELSEDLAALSCYVRFPISDNCSEIKVINTVLTEIFDDQKNILTFINNSGKKDYFTFDSGDKQKTFSCE